MIYIFLPMPFSFYPATIKGFENVVQVESQPYRDTDAATAYCVVLIYYMFKQAAATHGNPYQAVVEDIERSCFRDILNLPAGNQ